MKNKENIKNQINNLEELIKRIKEERDNKDKIINILLKIRTEWNYNINKFILFIIINLVIIHLFYFIVLYNNNINIIIVKE